MNIIDKHTFFELTQHFAFIPHSQSYGWWAMNSVENEDRFAFFVDNIETPSLACMGHIKKMFGLKMLQIESECLSDEKNIDSKKIREFYREIKQAGFDMVELNSSLPYNPMYEIGIREAGYLRPVGMFSSQLSNWVYLQSEIRYNENWKRNLKKAEKYNLSLQVFENPSEEQIRFFSDFYNKFTNQKGFSHVISYARMRALLQSNNFSLALVVDTNGSVLAGIVFYHYNDRARLLYSARNIEEKEDVGATFFMYDKLFEYLKNRGFKIFDMEKLLPSIHSTQSVFLFKCGIKGEKVLYCGEFSYYKRFLYRPLMYFVKNFLFKGVEV